MIEGFQEIIEARQAALLDTLDPGLDFEFSLQFGEWLIKYGGQLFLKFISQFQGWGMSKQASQHLAIFGGPVFTLLAESPYTAIQFLVSGFIKFVFQPFEFMLAQFTCRITVFHSDMETVNGNLCAFDFLAHCICEAFVHVATHCVNGLQQVQRYRAQKNCHGVFLAARQHP